jgi:hypothetical protein
MFNCPFSVPADHILYPLEEPMKHARWLPLCLLLAGCPAAAARHPPQPLLRSACTTPRRDTFVPLAEADMIVVLGAPTGST